MYMFDVAHDGHPPKKVDVTMDWDGTSKVATLVIGGSEVSGNPDDVRRIYDVFNHCEHNRIASSLLVRELEERLRGCQLALDQLERIHGKLP